MDRDSQQLVLSRAIAFLRGLGSNQTNLVPTLKVQVSLVKVKTRPRVKVCQELELTKEEGFLVKIKTRVVDFLEANSQTLRILDHHFLDNQRQALNKHPQLVAVSSVQALQASTSLHNLELQEELVVEVCLEVSKTTPKALCLISHLARLMRLRQVALDKDYLEQANSLNRRPYLVQAQLSHQHRILLLEGFLGPSLHSLLLEVGYSEHLNLLSQQLVEVEDYLEHLNHKDKAYSVQ